MTGFRLSLGGAQEFFGVRPDLSTFGKIIGGGMPVGAYGGKAEIMDYVSPVGPVYQAGTLSGNPVAMAAGLVMLKALRDDQKVYERLTEKCRKITQGIQGVLDELKLNFTMNQVGSMYSLFFSDEKITNFEEAQRCDTEAFGRFFQGMLAEGVYLAPSQFESLFLSDALTDEDIAHIIEAHRKVLTEMYG
jgi:glutamate-1-semialdehyde 2,1-aminomutase